MLRSLSFRHSWVCTWTRADILRAERRWRSVLFMSSLSPSACSLPLPERIRRFRALLMRTILAQLGPHLHVPEFVGSLEGRSLRTFSWRWQKCEIRECNARLPISGNRPYLFESFDIYIASDLCDLLVTCECLFSCCLHKPLDTLVMCSPLNLPPKLYTPFPTILPWKQSKIHLQIR